TEHEREKYRESADERGEVPADQTLQRPIRFRDPTAHRVAPAQVDGRPSARPIARLDLQPGRTLIERRAEQVGRVRPQRVADRARRDRRIHDVDPVPSSGDLPPADPIGPILVAEIYHGRPFQVCGSIERARDPAGVQAGTAGTVFETRRTYRPRDTIPVYAQRYRSGHRVTYPGVVRRRLGGTGLAVAVGVYCRALLQRRQFGKVNDRGDGDPIRIQIEP